jgi:hypothetical protein
MPSFNNVPYRHPSVRVTRNEHCRIDLQTTFRVLFSDCVTTVSACRRVRKRYNDEFVHRDHGPSGDSSSWWRGSGVRANRRDSVLPDCAALAHCKAPVTVYTRSPRFEMPRNIIRLTPFRAAASSATQGTARDLGSVAASCAVDYPSAFSSCSSVANGAAAAWGRYLTSRVPNMLRSNGQQSSPISCCTSRCSFASMRSMCAGSRPG